MRLHHHPPLAPLGLLTLVALAILWPGSTQGQASATWHVGDDPGRRDVTSWWWAELPGTTPPPVTVDRGRADIDCADQGHGRQICTVRATGAWSRVTVGGVVVAERTRIALPEVWP